MPSQDNSNDRIALLQGTLDLLILKTLVLGSCHGQGIARSIQRQSKRSFSLIMVRSRRARFYSLTAKGRQRLVEKTSEWQRLTRAMGLILDGRPSSQEI